MQKKNKVKSQEFESKVNSQKLWKIMSHITQMRQRATPRASSVSQGAEGNSEEHELHRRHCQENQGSDGGKVESLGIWELIEKLRCGGRELRRCMQKEVGNEDSASFLPEHKKWKLVLS